MASWEDVRRLALALPDTDENPDRELRMWRVHGKLFVWERPLRRPDLAALGATAPAGPILGVRTADLGEKEALLAANPDTCFTIPHFDGYPAVLFLLDELATAQLGELVVDAWLARAPTRLAKQFLAERG